MLKLLRMLWQFLRGTTPTADDVLRSSGHGHIWNISTLCDEGYHNACAHEYQLDDGTELTCVCACHDSDETLPENLPDDDVDQCPTDDPNAA